MTSHGAAEPIIAKLSGAALGFASIAGAAILEVSSPSVDAQTIVAYAAGLIGTGGLFWRIWGDRTATVRADATMEKRLDDLKARLDDLEHDRDFWRSRAMGEQEP